MDIPQNLDLKPTHVPYVLFCTSPIYSGARINPLNCLVQRDGVLQAGPRHQTTTGWTRDKY